MLNIQNLTHRYGNHTVFENLNLTIPPGGIYGLLGNNGAGKTTLLRMICTTLQPQQGGITFRGDSIFQQPVLHRNRIGVVNGGMNLYDQSSAKAFLHFFGHLHGLKRQQIDRRIDELDEVLHFRDFLLQPAEQLSTGMRQKIIIARAILHEPEVLILDEASSGLDILTRKTLFDFVAYYRSAKRTILYSTHIMEEIERLCDTICILDQGQVVSETTRNRLLLKGQSMEEHYFESIQMPSQALRLSRTGASA
ncbi:ABC transporter ATP-binding protein [Deinococcus roseus]|uniref:Sodium ABC transporter ATP-binding protein n=1 Tax=Deinococcus roseus TaxID=392414 RepID=A0ABQ2DDZ1_9DEIO|nr:ATP-binding cassette domain-containing protein [Deinococcus roseus]GGJ54934.1 sodium ABC transporter ATP-binding protein [Deinococcus roseus]